MVRTKADAYVKASVKAPRKQSVLSNVSSLGSPRSGKMDKYAGGNPYCPRPTPNWQKPITSFFSSCQTASTVSQEQSASPESNSNEIDVPSGSKD